MFNSHIDPPSIIPRNPPTKVVSRIDNDEGFMLVNNKKKRRKNNLGQPKPNSLKKIPPPSQPALPPSSVDLSQDPTLDFGTISSNLTPSTFSQIFFKEIDDGYIFEIIPTKESKLNEINMDMEPSIWDDSSKIDSMNIKRHGRPPRSRNKSTSKLDGYTCNNPVTINKIVCQDSLIVSQ